METLLLLLAAYGLCFGLMNEKVSVINRVLYAIPLFRTEEGTFFQRMLSCAYCTGFHTGWVVWGAARLLGAGPVRGWAAELLEVGLFAFASSVFCYSLDTMLRWLER